ncbi:hypothetical protein AB0N99_28680 [Streptomyces sp. NPDC093272]|uniref:phage integrase central domain-containing protein n=1 Tax=Streptomyces sp. NPDC093272 TaxID=3154981 RepID=UPI0034373861
MQARGGRRTASPHVTRFWQTGVRGAPGTVKRIDERVRLHIRPHLGTVPLRDITPAVLREYIAMLDGECAPRYARQILTSLSNIFETAIDDKRLVRNPMRAKSVRWPKAPEDQREAWPLETALRVRDAIGPRYRIAAVVALGCGLRQGGGLRVVAGGRRLRPRGAAHPPAGAAPAWAPVLHPPEGRQDARR